MVAATARVAVVEHWIPEAAGARDAFIVALTLTTIPRPFVRSRVPADDVREAHSAD
jgi:hypothetical protein